MTKKGKLSVEKKLSVGQNTLFNSAGSLYYLACQWLITVLVVRLSGYEDAGTLSLCMSITNMFYTLASFGMRDFQVSDYTGKYSPGQYVTTRLLTCTAAAVLCCGFVGLNRGYTGYEAACIILYMLFRVAEALVDTFQAMEQQAERMDYNFISFLLRGTFLLGGFSLILWLTQNLLLAILCITLTSFAVVLLFDFPVGRRLTGFRLTFSFQVSRQLLWECMPLMCNSFLTTAVISVPRSILEGIWGSYIMGIYASIATPATIVQSGAIWLYTPVITVFTRHYARRDARAYYTLYHKIWALLAAAFAVVFVVAGLLGRWGLGLLFDEAVVEYAGLLLPVLGTTALIACAYFLGALITITRKLKVILIGNAVAAVLAAALSLPLIRSFGMNGVNYVIYISMGANVLILFIALTCILRRHFQTGAEQ